MRRRGPEAVALLAVAMVTAAGWLVLGDGLVLVVGALAAVLVGLGLALDARERKRGAELAEKISALATRHEEAQFELQSLVWLASILRVRLPLPFMGWYAIQPDGGAVLMRAVRERKPRLVVDLGSGVSTILLAYLLEPTGGRVVALEHDEWYATSTARELRAHGLERVAQVRHAPLREVTLHGRAWKWYDPESFRDLVDIDLLVVDGPPGWIQERSRYPALPLLFDALAEGALVILDDVKRPDEKAVTDEWRNEFPMLAVEFPGTWRGTAVFTKRTV